MKEYRAVGNRCAFNLTDLELGFDYPYLSKYLDLFLIDQGFQIINVDIIALARECIGKCKYVRGAAQRDAPNSFDCSGFCKWIYGQMGVWLPRRSIQQSLVGEEVEIQHVKAGDLIFTSGYINYFHLRPGDVAIGHVGIATGDGTVIHAAGRKCETGVVETPIDRFLPHNEYIPIVRRYVSPGTRTLIVPHSREIESSDDLRWIIRQNEGTIKKSIDEGVEMVGKREIYERAVIEAQTDLMSET